MTLAEEARLLVDLRWLRGPLDLYLKRWHTLLGDPKPPPDAKTAEDALGLVQGIRMAEVAFLAGHGGFKQNLTKLETTAKIMKADGDKSTPEQSAALRGAIDTAAKLADAIAIRPKETARAKAKAKALAGLLKAW